MSLPRVPHALRISTSRLRRLQRLPAHLLKFSSLIGGFHVGGGRRRTVLWTYKLFLRVRKMILQTRRIDSQARRNDLRRRGDSLRSHSDGLQCRVRMLRARGSWLRVCGKRRKLAEGICRLAGRFRALATARRRLSDDVYVSAEMS